MNRQTPDAVAILYENDVWLDALFERLTQCGVAYVPVRMQDAALEIDLAPVHPLYYNRVSPSSYVRGHGPAIPFARATLDRLTDAGQRVVNGGRSFHVETSKVAQHLLLGRIGVHTPRTIVFNNRAAVLDQAAELRFPAMLKPDCGGSGALVRRVDDFDHLRATLTDETDLFGPDHLLLLQEKVTSPEGAIVRTEFIDGELVYAMRVYPHNTFNLCPADACERFAVDPDGGTPSARFEPYPEIAPDAVAQAREIVRAAQLDVGGVEYIEDADGIRWFIDINATSVFRDDISGAFQVDAWEKLAAFIDREFHKERAKRSRSGLLST